MVPTVRKAQMREFRAAWAPLFAKHAVTLVTVWDADSPAAINLDVILPDGDHVAADFAALSRVQADMIAGRLLCSRTDACRNLGFAYAAHANPDVVLTMDDDVRPIPLEHFPDPIKKHLDTLARRVPTSWMNTAHLDAPYLRGFPYRVRVESPVMLSHGVWTGTPDFDGETQLSLEASPGGVPYTLPYYVGPIPKGVYAPICGMALAFNRDALPYVYFAPMGPDSGYPDLHRFADIFMGVRLAEVFAAKGWAIYTGASTILHSRASDARKNFEQEKLGRRWIEEYSAGQVSSDAGVYWSAYDEKAERYARMVRGILNENK